MRTKKYPRYHEFPKSQKRATSNRIRKTLRCYRRRHRREFRRAKRTWLNWLWSAMVLCETPENRKYAADVALMFHIPHEVGFTLFEDID